jgi:hypothetical protein
MNLTKSYKEWQDKSPEEQSGQKITRPKRWQYKIQAYKNRKRMEKS